MDPGDDIYIEFDVDECALGAIVKALVNYELLNERNDILIECLKYFLRGIIDFKEYG